MRTMEIPASLAIGRAGAGTNNIPVDAMSKRGVPVFNAPGATHWEELRWRHCLWRRAT
jgi:D-3-phosphoglycerate dehydrogenase